MLYISCSPETNALAHRLLRALDARGIEAWISSSDIATPVAFDHRSANAWRNCAAFVVLIGSEKRGPMGEREVEMARERLEISPAFRIIPVLVGATPASRLPESIAGFIALSTADVAKTSERDVRELARQIAESLDPNAQIASKGPGANPRSFGGTLRSMPGKLMGKVIGAVSYPFKKLMHDSVRSLNSGDKVLKVELGRRVNTPIVITTADPETVRKVIATASAAPRPAARADETRFNMPTPAQPRAVVDDDVSESAALEPQGAAPQTDHVRFSAFAPASVQVPSKFVLDIWAYVNAQRADVLERATKRGKKVEVGEEGTAPLERGSVLSLGIDIDGMTCEPPTRSLTWLGDPTNASFEITVPADAHAGTRVGKARINHDLIPLTTLYFEIEVGAATKASTDLNGREERVRSVFVSYASPDRAEAARYKLDAQTLGIDAFVDAITLRAGANWEAALWSRIDSSDRLCLLWSRNAKASPWVEQEWRHALLEKGLDFIQPVPLVDPRDAAPPPELAALQFNSVERMVIDYERNRRPPD